MWLKEDPTGRYADLVRGRRYGVTIDLEVIKSWIEKHENAVVFKPLEAKFLRNKREKFTMLKRKERGNKKSNKVRTIERIEKEERGRQNKHEPVGSAQQRVKATFTVNLRSSQIYP